MQPQLIVDGVPRVGASGAAAKASLWLRLGFFGGVGLVVVMASRLANGEGGALINVASLVFGIALAAFSLRRSWRLLDARDEPIT